jgi:outer membrane biosynthesis protein TonB
VTIVTNAPPAELRAAIPAPEPQPAQAEQPVPQAQPEPVPPVPQPTPRPAPQPAPQPPAKPAPPAPTPKPAPKPAPKPEKTLDLDALAASLSKMTKSAKPTSAAKGAPRPETAAAARPALGSAAAAAALNGLAEELQRRWNPNCDVADARAVVVQVTFNLNGGGAVVDGSVHAQVRGPDTPAASSARIRAISAVYAASPFRSLPREFYGQSIRVNFDASKACS